MLRKFNIKLNRENLEKIYFTYIRPLLEYACELWDGCTILDFKKIEQIQHEAARIVTGLPKFNSFSSGIKGSKQSYKYNGLSLLRIL
jgi:hypothetical protein